MLYMHYLKTQQQNTHQSTLCNKTKGSEWISSFLLSMSEAWKSPLYLNYKWKSEQTENSTVLRSLREVRSHCPPDWGDGQANAKDPNFTEQNPWATTSLGTRAEIGKSALSLAKCCRPSQNSRGPVPGALIVCYSSKAWPGLSVHSGERSLI